jgi:hypothetical protein
MFQSNSSIRSFVVVTTLVLGDDGLILVRLIVLALKDLNFDFFYKSNILCVNLIFIVIFTDMLLIGLYSIWSQNAQYTIAWVINEKLHEILTS